MAKTILATPTSVQAQIDTAIANLINGAPGALNTLEELADALGDDANAMTTLTTSIATKLAKASNLSDLPSASTARTNLGLGSVTNTSDADKPISTAQQTALDARLGVGAFASPVPTLTGGALMKGPLTCKTPKADALASTPTLVYTCPAGKRAMFRQGLVKNTDATNLTEQIIYVVPSGGAAPAGGIAGEQEVGRGTATVAPSAATAVAASLWGMNPGDKLYVWGNKAATWTFFVYETPDTDRLKVVNIEPILTADGMHAVYTVPAGKQALIMNGQMQNSTAASINISTTYTIAGTDFPFLVAFPLGARAGNSSVLVNIGQYVLQAGDQIKLQTSADGINVSLLFAEYDIPA